MIIFTVRLCRFLYMILYKKKLNSISGVARADPLKRCQMGRARTRVGPPGGFGEEPGGGGGGIGGGGGGGEDGEGDGPPPGPLRGTLLLAAAAEMSALPDAP